MYSIKDVSDSELEKFKTDYTDMMTKYVSALDRYQETANDCKKLIMEQIKL